MTMRNLNNEEPSRQIEELCSIEELYSIEELIFDQRTIFVDRRAIFDLQIKQLSAD